MPRKNISIEDVARRAKVSITTVSRVINNVPTVSPKNRARVEEAITHLKFKPNVSAQRLARGYNNSIGLVMPGYPGIFYSFYAVELIRGVGHACETKKLDMVFHITNGDNPINTNNVGGIIFADIIENRRQVEASVAAGTPCLIINNRVDDLDVPFIAVDNEEGGRMAGDYLVSLGHKNIAAITGNLNTQAGAHRFMGFQKFLKSKKVDLPEQYIYKGDYSRRCARAATAAFLELPNPPTAIFAASDEMALEAITVIMENGKKVPEDISVIGFDDNPACLFGAVALTTIKQLLFKMAEDSVHLLSTLMTGKGTVKKKTILAPELIVRESCAKLR
jgi:LacI family transcriptional regulator